MNCKNSARGTLSRLSPSPSRSPRVSALTTRRRRRQRRSAGSAERGGPTGHQRGRPAYYVVQRSTPRHCSSGLSNGTWQPHPATEGAPCCGTRSMPRPTASTRAMGSAQPLGPGYVAWQGGRRGGARGGVRGLGVHVVAVVATVLARLLAPHRSIRVIGDRAASVIVGLPHRVDQAPEPARLERAGEPLLLVEVTSAMIMRLSTMWSVDATIDADGRAPWPTRSCGGGDTTAGRPGSFARVPTSFTPSPGTADRHFVRFAADSERDRAAVEAETAVVDWLMCRLARSSAPVLARRRPGRNGRDRVGHVPRGRVRRRRWPSTRRRGPRLDRVRALGKSARRTPTESSRSGRHRRQRWSPRGVLTGRRATSVPPMPRCSVNAKRSTQPSRASPSAPAGWGRSSAGSSSTTWSGPTMR